MPEEHLSYVTVRRGLTGYRAITMVWDEATGDYKISKRDPGVYQARLGAVDRAIAIARTNGLECAV
jgi:hypothetical protein